MAECRRCERETERRTLDGYPLCRVCAEWYSQHQRSRDVNQRSLKADYSPAEEED